MRNQTFIFFLPYTYCAIKFSYMLVPSTVVEAVLFGCISFKFGTINFQKQRKQSKNISTHRFCSFVQKYKVFCVFSNMCRNIDLFIYLSIYLFVYLFIYLLIYLFIYLFIYLIKTQYLVKTQFHLANNHQAEQTITSHSYKLFTSNLYVPDNNSLQTKRPKTK